MISYQYLISRFVVALVSTEIIALLVTRQVTKMKANNITFAAASVAAPNTPESDAMEFVLHNVEIHFNDKLPHKTTINARCPLHAIELVKAQLGV